MTTTTTKADNYIAGKFQPPIAAAAAAANNDNDDDEEKRKQQQQYYMNVTDPSNGAVIGTVCVSDDRDVHAAVAAAKAAWKDWNRKTVKARAAVVMKFHSIVEQRTEQLAALVSRENGKNITEAAAEVAKGNETVEYAAGLSAIATGQHLRVSTAVHCQDYRRSLGVVVSVVPFNFPFMVPMWTVPIALVLGNCVVLKPSEKVPLTMRTVAAWFREAGVPAGVFNMVQGTGAAAVRPALSHPDVAAVTFVGSSPVAELVKTACCEHRKRCTALGGAKNHLVALDDCDVDTASTDIVISFAGCAGQRCMAASVLLLAGNNKTKRDELLNAVTAKAANIQLGQGPGEMGPVIDEAAVKKIRRYIDEAEAAAGVTVAVDGRKWKENVPNTKGNWIGPTVLIHENSADAAMKEEIFGPVLSVYACESWEEAVQIENDSPFGNAAAVYTSSGAAADWFCTRFQSAMLGVNIGIPVPREPFSFGGLYGTVSKFGDADITGDGAVEFFTNRIKVSTKWPPIITDAADADAAAETGKRKAGEISASPVVTAATAAGTTDRANFAGSM